MSFFFKRQIPPPNKLPPRFKVPVAKSADILESVIPDQQDWDNAHKLFDHTKKCNCSTCILTAKLSKAIRDRAVA